MLCFKNNILIEFQSNKRKQLSENPELDYFMNESVSDVVFVIEGQSLPAMKSILSLKIKVFRAMFSGDFKEQKDKEVIIEDTTYEAFKTFIRFIYCDDLVLKDDNDFEMFEELCKLCDIYDVSRLENRLTDRLYGKSLKLLESKEDFEEVWDEMQSILKIAFEYKIEKLMDKVMEFIDENFDHFVDEDDEVLNELNDSTDGRLFPLMADKCHDFWKEKNRLNNKIKEMRKFTCKSCEKANLVTSVSANCACYHCTHPNNLTVDFKQFQI